MTDPCLIAMIADRFVQWQTPYGRPDAARCPFVFTEQRVTSVNFHSPTFMAIGLYRAFDVTGRSEYRAAADRYIAWYLACLRDPPAGEPDHYGRQWIEFMERRHGSSDYRRRWAINILTWPFIYGMALAGYSHFRARHRDEYCFDSKAAALFEWLLSWRWDQGSYFRNGYGSPEHGIEDAANSDDNSHIGRGLVGYARVSARADVLAEARGLARYYLNECKPGTYDGCWSSRLGTWVIAPTAVDHFEHFSGRKSCDIAWGFSSVGAVEFLTDLAAQIADQPLTTQIAEKCTRSMRWQFDACQFEDGAVGMSGRDDKWLGMAAGAILSYLRTRDAGFLSDIDRATYRVKAERAGDWIMRHLTPERIDQGGYIKVTGASEPRPPENLAWLLGWTLEALTRLHEI